jgi:hypothetical protein
MTWVDGAVITNTEKLDGDELHGDSEFWKGGLGTIYPVGNKEVLSIEMLKN